jgi:hypothetical protein
MDLFVVMRWRFVEMAVNDRASLTVGKVQMHSSENRRRLLANTGNHQQI